MKKTTSILSQISCIALLLLTPGSVLSQAPPSGLGDNSDQQDCEVIITTTEDANGVTKTTHTCGDQSVVHEDYPDGKKVVTATRPNQQIITTITPSTTFTSNDGSVVIKDIKSEQIFDPTISATPVIRTTTKTRTTTLGPNGVPTSETDVTVAISPLPPATSPPVVGGVVGSYPIEKDTMEPNGNVTVVSDWPDETIIVTTTPLGTKIIRRHFENETTIETRYPSGAKTHVEIVVTTDDVTGVITTTTTTTVTDADGNSTTTVETTVEDVDDYYLDLEFLELIVGDA